MPNIRLSKEYDGFMRNHMHHFNLRFKVLINSPSDIGIQ